MPYKDKNLAEPNGPGGRDEEAVGSDSETLERDASALARLLIYATAEARLLDSEDIAMLIEEAIETLKGKFALKDSDVLPTETHFSH